MKVVNLEDYKEFSTDKMKKLNVFQTTRFFCDVYCLEPGQEQKGHVHQDQDKVYFVIEGAGTFRVGPSSQSLERGQGTMAPAGEEHAVVNHTQDQLRVLVFMAPNPS